MRKKPDMITRRDFVRSAAVLMLGAAYNAQLLASDDEKLARVVLVRDKSLFDTDGNIDAVVVQKMIDEAIAELFDVTKPSEAFEQLFDKEDIVGIKSNEWGPLPTPESVENALAGHIAAAGVAEKNISIDDRGVLHDPVFKYSTALINSRPMRTHHWSGVGSLLKNYIMFDPQPWNYHDNYCADLATLWDLPVCKGKTRLNVLVMFTPLFHGVGRHHFDEKYTWRYNGLVIGTDPVACDAVGLAIMQAKRNSYFGEESPIKPTPHHILLADTRHHLGIADLSKIELIRIGWEEGVLI